MIPVVVIARRPSTYARRIVAGLAATGLPPRLLLTGSPVERLIAPVEKILRVRRQLGLREAFHYVRRLGKQVPVLDPPPTLSELLQSTRSRHQLYDAINSGFVLSTLAVHAPSIVVLAGTGVVDRAFLAANRDGFTVNGHPALLPGIRGVDVIEWALAEDRPLGVSAHLVVPSVDAGDLLVTEPIEINAGDTSLEALKARIIIRQAGAVIAATVALARGYASPQSHDLGRSVFRLTAPAEVHAEARRKLADRVATLTRDRTPLAEVSQG